MDAGGANRSTRVDFDGFVRASHGSLLDGHGQPIVLRGVGLGNWLLTEGYMWRFPPAGPQSARQIEALIGELVGAAAAEAFWRTYRERFIGEADIERIAAEGFDHVRLPMNARFLIDERGALLGEGLAPIDDLIAWCSRHRLWVILDLHAAPGGQTGTNIDDSPRGRPDLFEVGGRYRELTVELWTQLAARYRDETVIAGYDLLNEPLPHESGDRYASHLVDLYRDLTRAIRAVDEQHLIIYEGTRWSTDWSIFSEVWDPNSMLQFHKYWSPPDRASIAGYVERGRELSLPIYMGEGGENDVAWLQTAFGLYEDLGISWNFWPWKKLQTWTSPLSVVPPPGWAAIVEYASGRGPRPPREAAERTLEELLEAIPAETCESRGDILAALFHRVPIRLAAEAFGFGGLGISHRVRRGHAPAGFRHDDGVTIRTLPGESPEMAFDHDDRPGPWQARFEVVLEPGDWVEYAVDVPTASVLEVELAVRTESDCVEVAALLLVDGEPVAVHPQPGGLRGTTGWTVAPGRHRLRVEGACHGTVIEWLGAVPAPSIEAPATSVRAPTTG